MATRRIGLVFGGRSPEHEISLRSARSVHDHLLAPHHEIIPIAITPEGQWYSAPSFDDLMDLAAPNPRLKASEALSGDLKGEGIRRVVLAPDPTIGGLLYLNEGRTFDGESSPLKVDVLLPVLHGPQGEDGTVQGLFDLADIPYVGNGVVGSATGMDKAIMKSLFAQAGLSQTPWQAVLRREIDLDREGVLDRAIEALGLPIFVKPANMGSSVGVTRADNRPALSQALDIAARYDRKIILEAGVDGREVELSVLGNDDPKVSLPGEILSETAVYSFEAKYQSQVSKLTIPADLPEATIDALQEAALRAFRAIDGAGLARMDFFVERSSGEILINEVNTFPGFTSISMYPKLWEASGLPYAKLLERMMDLALERHSERRSLSTQRL